MNVEKLFNYETNTIPADDNCHYSAQFSSMVIQFSSITLLPSSLVMKHTQYYKTAL